MISYDHNSWGHLYLRSLAMYAGIFVCMFVCMYYVCLYVLCLYVCIMFVRMYVGR